MIVRLSILMEIKTTASIGTIRSAIEQDYDEGKRIIIVGKRGVPYEGKIITRWVQKTTPSDPIIQKFGLNIKKTRAIDDDFDFDQL